MKSSLELYGTLGPSACDKSTLKEMFHYGMTGLRLNLSHRSLSECEDWLNNVYEVSEELHIVPDLLVDLQGPEVRVGILKKTLELIPGDKVILTDSDDQKDPVCPADIIPVPSSVIPFLKNGQQVLLDDGKILLEIENEGHKSHVAAKILTGGLLKSRKSLAIRGQSVNLPTLTDKDLKNLSLLSSYRVTGVMLPFVRNADDLIILRKVLLSNGNHHVRIFAKIENQEGVNRLPSLLPYCDHVVIARGDLANSVSLAKLPAIQKKIALLCNRTKTPFMVVTQMLASMEHSPVPTRAEVSDIFNAVLDGASSLMLTGETAVGKYPSRAIKVLSDVSFEALRYRMESKFPLI